MRDKECIQNFGGGMSANSEIGNSENLQLKSRKTGGYRMDPKEMVYGRKKWAAITQHFVEERALFLQL
jgi:hypothetical protein